MKNLELMGVQKLDTREMKEIFGDGQWSWKEAGFAFLIGGAIGVGFYYLGTCQ